MKDIDHKGFQKLKSFLQSHAPAALAFSGGTDSAFLAYVANSISPGSYTAFTFDTPYMNRSQIREARDFCKKYDIPHKPVPLPVPEEILNNPRNRCYLCKLNLFSTLKKIASREGLNYVFDGSNTDDTQVFRPGRQALKELGIVSPLLESNLDKKEIRMLSRELDLPTWNKPSNACLLTRLPYSRKVSREILARIEQAEEYLHALGFGNIRVRTHDTLARIEVPREDFHKMLQKEIQKNITGKFKQLGYYFITLDLEGFRSGSYDMQQPKTENNGSETSGKNTEKS